MAGAEVSNIKGGWVDGNLVLETLNGIDIVSIGATTGMMAVPAGYRNTATASATLTSALAGQVIVATASTALTFTVPPAGSTNAHCEYTIVSGNSSGSGGIIVLSGITTEVFMGCGWSSSAVPYQLTLAASTSKPGDAIRLVAGGSTTAIWWVNGLVGTWISTT